MTEPSDTQPGCGTFLVAMLGEDMAFAFAVKSARGWLRKDVGPGVVIKEVSGAEGRRLVDNYLAWRKRIPAATYNWSA